MQIARGKCEKLLGIINQIGSENFTISVGTIRTSHGKRMVVPIDTNNAFAIRTPGNLKLFSLNEKKGIDKLLNLIKLSTCPTETIFGI